AVNQPWGIYVTLALAALPAVLGVLKVVANRTPA
ncbi:unnamed protein product, partial [marine sediment metagenome]